MCRSFEVSDPWCVECFTWRCLMLLSFSSDLCFFCYLTFSWSRIQTVVVSHASWQRCWLSSQGTPDKIIFDLNDSQVQNGDFCVSWQQKGQYPVYIEMNRSSCVTKQKVLVILVGWGFWLQHEVSPGGYFGRRLPIKECFQRNYPGVKRLQFKKFKIQSNRVCAFLRNFPIVKQETQTKIWALSPIRKLRRENSNTKRCSSQIFIAILEKIMADIDITVFTIAFEINIFNITLTARIATSLDIILGSDSAPCTQICTFFCRQKVSASQGCAHRHCHIILIFTFEHFFSLVFFQWYFPWDTVVHG